MAVRSTTARSGRPPADATALAALTGSPMAPVSASLIGGSLPVDTSGRLPTSVAFGTCECAGRGPAHRAGGRSADRRTRPGPGASRPQLSVTLTDVTPVLTAAGTVTARGTRPQHRRPADQPAQRLAVDQQPRRSPPAPDLAEAAAEQPGDRLGVRFSSETDDVNEVAETLEPGRCRPVQRGAAGRAARSLGPWRLHAGRRHPRHARRAGSRHARAGADVRLLPAARRRPAPSRSPRCCR